MRIIVDPQIVMTVQPPSPFFQVSFVPLHFCLPHSQPQILSPIEFTPHTALNLGLGMFHALYCMCQGLQLVQWTGQTGKPRH